MPTDGLEFDTGDFGGMGGMGGPVPTSEPEKDTIYVPPPPQQETAPVVIPAAAPTDATIPTPAPQSQPPVDLLDDQRPKPESGEIHELD